MANIKNSPAKLLSGAISAAGAYDWGGKRANAEKEAQGEYDKMRDKFMGLETSNLYGDVSNPYANMENTMEDLTVNQQQAQFQAQQNQQTQANVMGQMRGAAGGSGVAGLAQAMSNQGAIQAQQASASIGQQESANQQAAAQQAGQLQKMDRQGAWKADMTKRAGAQVERDAVKDKTNTLFGMSINRLDTAKGAVAAGDEAFQSGVSEAFSPTGGMF
tara:strand:- start:631 stop:1281 length:651 start_codon:yes stop_codon:yes gene_type:complete